ncbi:MAG: hypothetical protein PHN98_08490 [Smithellaceae bacterium]|nr:hypothetical protein [Smithellaceae bacterium]
MKRFIIVSTFCAVLLFCAVLVSPAFAQMTKVDEEELSLTNASVTGTVNPEAEGAAGVVDKTGSVHFTSTNEANEGSRASSNPILNYLPVSGPESSYYHHPWANNGTNQLYWRGGTTTHWNRTYQSR